MTDEFRYDKNSKTRILREIGQRLRLERKKMGLSQENLAAMSGVSKQTISLAENGEREMKILTTAALAKTLGFSIDNLVSLSPVVDAHASVHEMIDGLDRQRYRIFESMLRAVYYGYPNEEEEKE